MSRPSRPVNFETLGVALVSGRSISDEDRGGAQRVALINEAFDRRYGGGESLVSRSIASDLLSAQVVGVVSDLKPVARVESVPTIFVPVSQLPLQGMTYVLRGSVPADALIPLARDVVWDLDRTIPLDGATTLHRAIAETVAVPRFQMLLSTSFAALALLLAAVGVYGVMATTVGERARELGLRQALGAERRQIRRMVLVVGARTTIPGVAIGLAASTWLTELLETRLFGVSPLPWALQALVALVVLVVALVASYLPARRASALDPVATLRAE